MDISVVTSARSDFGLLLPLMTGLNADDSFNVTVLATGMHFLHEFGSTIDEVRASPVSDRIVELPTFVNPDTSENCAKAVAAGTGIFAGRYAGAPPDLLLVLGDRFDILPAVLAALPFQIPVAHISGGEVTEGAMDEYIRHAVTKLSHVHFTSTEGAARQVVQLGESPDRVFAVGEPGLDVIRQMTFDDTEAFYAEIGLNADRPTTIFTYHPETTDPDRNAERIHLLLRAAATVESQILFTYPNGDTGSDEIIARIEEFCVDNENARCVPSLGRRRYLNALKHMTCMVGNSSSGIVEAASFERPVVDVGDRQLGRLRPENVLHVGYDEAAVTGAWRQALGSRFRRTLKGLQNPYGDGHAVERIISALKKLPDRRTLWRKKFHDVES